MESIKVYGKKVSIHTENGWEKITRKWGAYTDNRSACKRR